MGDQRIEQAHEFLASAPDDNAMGKLLDGSVAVTLKRSSSMQTVVIAGGLLATLAWVAFLGWASGKIVGIW
jgi:hypothetical protein